MTFISPSQKSAMQSLYLLPGIRVLFSKESRQLPFPVGIILSSRIYDLFGLSLKSKFF